MFFVSIPTISLGLIISIGILHRKEAARKMGVRVAYVIAALCVILLVPSGGGGIGGWIIILAHFWWAFAILLIWQLIVIRILDKESVKAYFLIFLGFGRSILVAVQ